MLPIWQRQSFGPYPLLFNIWKGYTRILRTYFTLSSLSPPYRTEEGLEAMGLEEPKTILVRHPSPAHSVVPKSKVDGWAYMTVDDFRGLA